jgi:lipopolysaccharide export system permease protein
MLMLMALPFVFGPLRSKALGWQLISGLFFGLGFFFLDRFFGPFSQIYHWPPIVGASLPCLIMLGIFVFFSFRLG